MNNRTNLGHNKIGLYSREWLDLNLRQRDHINFHMIKPRDHKKLKITS